MRWSNRQETILGGIGGFCFGAVFILAITISLPINYNSLANTITYPDIKALPETVSTATKEYLLTSEIVNIGRDTLLYRIYPEPSLIASTDPDLIKLLNSWLVIYEEGNEPWRPSKPLDKTTQGDGT